MSKEPNIQVQVTYNGHQPIISVFEGNLDFEQVVLQRNEYAVKAFVPLDFFIEAISVYALEKFVLEPLLNPIAEKFDWRKAVSKYLNPIQPFNLVIKITAESMIIEAPLKTQHQITAEIWEIVQKTLNVIKADGINLSKIRFTPDAEGNLLILCYEKSLPTHIVNLDEQKIEPLSSRQVTWIEEETNQSAEDWVASIISRAEAYRAYIKKLQEQASNLFDDVQDDVEN